MDLDETIREERCKASASAYQKLLTPDGWQAIRQRPVLVQYEEIEKRTAEHRQYLAQLRESRSGAEAKQYIVLISLPGAIRGKDMELFYEMDTDSQADYVVELARNLGTMPGVYRVDLITRLIEQPDPIHGQPTETLLSNKEMGESSGSYIIRLPVGDSEDYMGKELFYEHINNFVDFALIYLKGMSRILGDEIGGGKPIWPAAIHGHHAASGQAAALLCGVLDVPMLFTAHSLGHATTNRYASIISNDPESDVTRFRHSVSFQVKAEELCLDCSEIVFTINREDSEKNWLLCDGLSDGKLEPGMREEGSFYPRMVVNPPGFQWPHCVPKHDDMDVDTEANEDLLIWAECLTNPKNPMILVDATRDLKIAIALVEAFKENISLRERANLTLILDISDDCLPEKGLTEVEEASQIQSLVEKYELVKQVACVDLSSELYTTYGPEIYRVPAKTKGVFIFLIEPFGFTLIEGVAYGGPVEKQKVIVVDEQSIAHAVLNLLDGLQLYESGKHLYSWQEHCKTYLSNIATVGFSKKAEHDSSDKSSVLSKKKYLIVIAVDEITDLGETTKKIFELTEKEWMKGSLGYVLSTSFSIIETRSFLLLMSFSEDKFDAIICNSGSELYYRSVKSGNLLVLDPEYYSRIKYRWSKESLKEFLSSHECSTDVDITESEEHSTPYCITYSVNMSGQVPGMSVLRKWGLRCRMVSCREGNRLNVIPVRASRAQALRYLYLRWGVELFNMLVVHGMVKDTDSEELLQGQNQHIPSSALEMLRLKMFGREWTKDRANHHYRFLKFMRPKKK
ncbi:hypothetical protein M0R45_006015 [Rubus argutus]|uniref:Sucrose phosphatase-like domain-containing protein n=1 Tax=Rubus argutus TaxID=59490 RepID=A0AAW1YPP3_RUBAR